MKRMGVVLVLAVVVSMLQAADTSNPYKPAIPMTNPETGQGYLFSLPQEQKAQIVMAISTAQTLQEACLALRAITVTNTDFLALMNDAKVTKNMVHMLVAKFGGYHEDVARALGTAGAKRYVALNKKFLNIAGAVSSSDSEDSGEESDTIINDSDSDTIVDDSDLESSDQTVLTWADADTIEKVHALVKEGADLHFATSEGITPLFKLSSSVVETMSAAQAVAILEYLKLLGVNFKVLTQRGENILRASVSGGRLQNKHTSIAWVKWLLAHGLSDFVNEEQPVLSLAIRSRNVDLVKLLLQFGADPSFKSQTALNTPLQEAELLIQRRPDDDASQRIVELIRQAVKDQVAKKQ